MSREEIYARVLTILSSVPDDVLEAMAFGIQVGMIGGRSNNNEETSTESAQH